MGIGDSKDSNRVRAGWLCFVLLALAMAAEALGSGPAAPSVLSVRASGANLWVTVNVPLGWQEVILESRASSGAAGWVPRAALHTQRAQRTTFRLPVSLKGQLLRARGEQQAPAPLSFYRGRHTFARRQSVLWRPDQGRGEVFTVAANGNLPASAAVPADATTTRTVTDSDIWQISGDTLYLFNQLRGLQIVDISNPDVPVRAGTLPLPAAGEQMYLLGEQHIVLLAQNDCSNDGNSRLLVVDVSGSTPQTVAELPVPGWVTESRLAGTALYVAAEGYLASAGTNVDSGQWGTLVSSFDLANAALPVARSSLWFAGENNAVMATNNWLFVATQDYSTADSLPVVQVIDISAADGTMRNVANIPTAGQVDDQSEMNVNGNVFAVVSEAFQSDTNNPSGGAWVTTLETFSLANAAAPARLGSLELANGDELFGTSFDGHLVYISTYQQVDPLWVVDLSNPAQPVVAGSVQVPGWSTVILPMGDRLLTVGVQTNRVAVSLFDVHDPGQPALLSTVLLGENYSWSEVNNDEKTLTVLPDLGLILVPYEGDTTNGWTSQVQFIDLATNTLTARGVLEHLFQPRRATAYHGWVVSISDEELLSVNVTNRDQPVVETDVELAWPVNQIFLQGNYLLEVATGGGWFGGSQPAVRVAPVAQPDAIANELDLQNVPVVGATLHNSRLYLLQSPMVFYGPIYGGPITLRTPAGFVPASIPATNLILSVVDVSALPAMSILGQTSLTPDNAANAGGSYQAVWPSPDALVWSSTGFNFWINPLVDVPALGQGLTAAVPGLMSNPALTNFSLTRPLATKSAPANPPPHSSPVFVEATAGKRIAQPGKRSEKRAAHTASSLPTQGSLAMRYSSSAQPFLAIPYWWPWWNNGGVRLLAFNVSDPSSPQLVSRLELNPTNAWGFSRSLTAQGLVYFTHELSDYVPLPAGLMGPAGGGWRVSEFLDVIDYTDATNPAVRPPVNVPGQLAGLSNDGAVLYLLGAAAPASNLPSDTRAAVNACAYDGVAAYLVASLPLPTTWPQPVAMNNGTVYLGRAAAAGQANSNNSLEAWSLSAQGQFVHQATVILAQPVSALGVFGNLVAAQDENNALTLFDASTNSVLRECGSGGPVNCLWFDLNQADGALGAGVWMPLDEYGVAAVPVAAQ